MGVRPTSESTRFSSCPNRIILKNPRTSLLVVGCCLLDWIVRASLPFNQPLLLSLPYRDSSQTQLTPASLNTNSRLVVITQPRHQSHLLLTRPSPHNRPLVLLISHQRKYPIHPSLFIPPFLLLYNPIQAIIPDPMRRPKHTFTLGRPKNAYQALLPVRTLQRLGATRRTI